MLTSQAQLTPKADEVAAKVIDGEAIIINLVDGSYYSMDDVGATVWDLIEDGCTVEQIVGSVTSSYAVDEEAARGDIEALCDRLLEEGLVAVGDGGDGGAPDRSPASGPSGEPLPYAAPELHKYTDMADLLALDPPMPGLDENPWIEGDDEG